MPKSYEGSHQQYDVICQSNVMVPMRNFPRFDVNPNTGGDLGLERRFEIAHQTIYHDAEHPSQIVLPIIER